MYLHHNGEFGEWGYFNGEVHDECMETDELSLEKIDVVARNVGVTGNGM